MSHSCKKNNKNNIDTLNFFFFLLTFSFFSAPLNSERNTPQDGPLLKDPFVFGTKSTQWIPVPVMLCRDQLVVWPRWRRKININEPEKNITKKVASLSTRPGLWPSICLLKVRTPPSPKLRGSEVTQLCNNNLCQWHSGTESGQVPHFFLYLLHFIKCWLKYVEARCVMSQGEVIFLYISIITIVFHAKGSKRLRFFFLFGWSVRGTEF